MTTVPGLRRLVLALMLAWLGWTSAATAQTPVAVRPEREQARIDFLIATVAGLDGAVFVRNGKSYGAGQAADHLRKKLAYAGARVQTAEQFIALCATGSWFSGRAYSIRYRDGQVVTSADFLREKLKKFDASPPGRGGDAGAHEPAPTG